MTVDEIEPTFVRQRKNALGPALLVARNGLKTIFIIFQL